MRLEQWFPDGLPPELHGEHAADLFVAAEAVLLGWSAAAHFYGKNALEVQDKGVDDPVTEADRAADRTILGLLRERRPGDPVLSEESKPPSTERVTGRLWVVDPLDGTKEFIARNGEFCVMVGLASDGTAVLGAVYQPDPQLLFLGVATGGAWLIERPALEGAQAAPLDVRDGRRTGLLRFVQSRSHPDARIERLERELGEVQIVRSGSVGIKCSLIARGQADLYVHPVPYLKEWDTCAPEAVLRGAGGRVTDCAGNPLGYGKADPSQRGGIFAARPEVWRSVRPRVRRVSAALFGGDPAPAGA